MKDMLVTIDGPAGAGKTTVSRQVAEKLGYRYLDTGALYRGVALEAKNRGVAVDDDAGLETLLTGLTLRFEVVDGSSRLFAGDTDITDKIRTPEISMLASAVSARPVVRAALLGLQRQAGAAKKVVCEGRDMGTVVFPQADVKFFLDASVEERARRRFEELADSDSSLTLSQIEDDIRKRDNNDRTRSHAPLKAADDAVIVDSTSLSIAGVVEKMLSLIKERAS